MRICLVSSYVPFINGGARFIVEWLEEKLREHGHQVERFYLPFIDSAPHLLEQIAAYRMIDLSQACDRMICFRPPAYVLPHPNKVLWFIHHIRVFYDMWDTQYRPVADDPGGRAIRQALIDVDTLTILEAKKVYTNSKVVTDRLKHFNKIDSTPLYPPLFRPERFRHDSYGDEIVAVCRIEKHKRQQLLVEAMAHVRSGVKLRICGSSSSAAHTNDLRQFIDSHGLTEKVIIDERWITEEEKVEYLAPALAVAYLPIDEDSYGYPSLEGAHAKKAVLTTTDAGGVLELVDDGYNGYIAAPDPRSVAEAMDKLYVDRLKTKAMGEANLQRLSDLKIDWNHVVEAMTT